MAAAQSPARPNPTIAHNFVGDTKIVDSTTNTRASIRHALKAYLLDAQQSVRDAPVQIQADIKLRVAGAETKEHTYTVTLTTADFDAAGFAQKLSHSNQNGAIPEPGVNGQHGSPVSTTSQHRPQQTLGEDEAVDGRPFKRQRTVGVSSSPAQQPAPKGEAPKDIAQLYTFTKDWHDEWLRQGGWLFDNVQKVTALVINNKNALDQKMDAVQNMLGQSLNSANTNVMAELSNVSKLIPWLENCRKTSADKVQAREEKWRTSSATFHDQARREREAAEARIEQKLDEQRQLLLSLTRTNDFQRDDVNALEANVMESREESLGAQLTAELNMEAVRARPVSKYDANTGTITIEDDT